MSNKANNKIIRLRINDKDIACRVGSTILEVALANGINIPHLCHHPDFPPKANCRVCVVEIKGKERLVTACSTLVAEGMEVFTNSPKVARLRKLNLEFIFAEHIEKCATCVWQKVCPLLRLAREHKILITTFQDRKGTREIYKFANAVEIDGTQCIDCRNCLDACSRLQKINFLELSGKGIQQEVVPTTKPEIDCIYCGQCALHCPVSAAQEQSDWEKVEEALKRKDKILVAQILPSVQFSIGEYFNASFSAQTMGQLAAALRKLGFQYVFDGGLAVDLMYLAEARQLHHRLNTLSRKAPKPLLHSSCPAWVKYIEFYHPNLIPHLSPIRSPHIIGGGIIKTYWAQVVGANPRQIEVVSITPCTAHKYEATRRELLVEGNYPVDYVLTVRELAWLLHRRHLDFPTISAEELDSPFNEVSGAGILYGVSGGTTEGVWRFLPHLLCRGRLCREQIDFEELRARKGIQESTLEVRERKIRAAVVSGIGNIKDIWTKLKEYDYIEVMACPDGCVGGGGQPFPTTQVHRQKRAQAIYEQDNSARIRRPQENKHAQDVLTWLEENQKEMPVLYTEFKKFIK
ncbi:hypothetical protein D6821_00525 [Candidatus Parcubacteria bacterium]|nr:MAG: hypothetical protein D6821_00525 [Candidatus Parcubacteria bacterium]